jgi:two-component system, cell cycle sensor histidine kinase and response regulator CckA
MSSSGVRVESSSRWRSLRWRLPLFIGGLCVALLAVVLYAAYRQVETTLLQTGAERARHAADQVSGLFGRSTAQSLDQLRQAAPKLSDYLRDPTDSRLASARAALAPLAPGPNRHITVWNAAGTLMFDAPAGPVADGQPDIATAAPLTRPPEVGLGLIRRAGDRLFTEVGVVVQEPAGSTNLGMIGLRSRLAVSPPDLLTRLVGDDARILFGNRRGDVWTDLVHTVSGPDVDLHVDGVKEYRTQAGDRRLGVLSGVPATPWAVWVEFPRAAILSPAKQFLERMIEFGLVMAAATMILVRWLTIRVTTPLATMIAAAEAMAGGDYSRRVDADRSDEIGRLGRAFNAMTEQVATAYRVLEDRVSERTTQLHAAVSKLHERNRHREAYLATIVDGSNDAIIGKGLDGIITSWNKGATEILGYTADEMVGTSVMRIIPEDRQQEERQILEQIAKGEGRNHFETQRLTRDGRLIDVSLTSSPIIDAAGVVVGASKVLRDVSEYKRAEAARRTSESRYRTLFDYAPDGIIIADAKGIYLDVNARLSEMLGYTRDELIGMDASRIVTRSELAEIDPALHAIVATGDYHREWQFVRKDGSVFLADVIATQMPDGHLLAMVRDVTDRDAAAAAVRAAEERMRFALEAAGVGIWDMDVESGVLKWSDVFEAHHGLRPGVAGGSLDDLLERIHPPDRESVVSAMRSVDQAGRDFELEYRAIWSDGSIRWLNGAGRIILGTHGEPVRGVGVSLDVTARHVLEAQLQQSQKMEAVGQLAGGVAHDFNNLLTAVLGFSRLVRESLEPGDPRILDIEEVIQAGVRATALTKQLLAFSRKEVIQPVAVDLNSLIETTHTMLRRLIGEDIDIALALGVDVAPIYADPGQLDQILMNLAVNARDAMPSGGRLTIETANVDLDASFGSKHGPVEAGPYVMLAVSDSGIGMTEEVRERLFEPFFTTKARGKGTGLGLSTVFGIVKQNGGYVYVYSEPAQGATFKIFFPRLAASTRTATPPVDGDVRPGTETVLLVEDEEAVRLLVRLILQNTGYRVLVAGNPREAEGVFAANRNDVAALITDVIMPGGSGPALFESLLRTKPDLRVLYMSGYTDDAMFRRGCLGQGVTFLQKPFAADALLRTLREVLDSPPSTPS